LYNKEAVIEAGGYKAEDFPAEDYSLWLRMTRLGKLKSIPEALLHYRLSGTSVTASRQELMRARAKSLLNSINIDPVCIEDFQTKYYQFFTAYDEIQNSSERQLLLYRDYKLLQTHLGSPTKFTDVDAHFIKWLAKNSEARSAAKRIFVERLKRKATKHLGFPNYL
jgi:hypothetical protein